jgi:hypothetical protein
VSEHLYTEARRPGAHAVAAADSPGLAGRSSPERIPPDTVSLPVRPASPRVRAIGVDLIQNRTEDPSSKKQPSSQAARSSKKQQAASSKQQAAPHDSDDDKIVSVLTAGWGWCWRRLAWAHFRDGVRHRARNMVLPVDDLVLQRLARARLARARAYAVRRVTHYRVDELGAPPDLRSHPWCARITPQPRPTHSG